MADFYVPSQVPASGSERVKLINDSVHSHLELQVRARLALRSAHCVPRPGGQARVS